MRSAFPMAIAVTVALHIAGAVAEIDMTACTHDTFVIYNQSAV